MSTEPYDPQKQGLHSLLVGLRIPEVPLYELGPDNKPVEVNPRDLFAGKLGILCGVPGAFTPVCTGEHLPEYVREYNSLRAMGVEVIAWVMAAWGQGFGAENKIRMLADPDASFTKALGMDFYSNTFKGPRSRRYAAIIQDIIILAFNVEPEGNPLTVSSPLVIKGELQELKKEGKVKVYEAQPGEQARKSVTVRMTVKQ